MTPIHQCEMKTTVSPAHVGFGQAGDSANFPVGRLQWEPSPNETLGNLMLPWAVALLGAQSTGGAELCVPSLPCRSSRCPADQ